MDRGDRHLNWRLPAVSASGHGQIPLKVPNVKFDFDVSVDSIQMLTDTLKSNSTLGTQLHPTIIRT